ncbi:hypothetical protein EN943_04680 [Mesorhizobium sp. M7A.F.Ca.US.006.01.1.1]|nr:hypothetical protein EN943_04680 [Mesorhizobium sp. M7A.F.Ca.US.006.01.1.1]
MVIGRSRWRGRVPSHPPLSCRTSPPQGGRLRAQPLSPISHFARRSGTPKLPISPLAGEMAGRPEGGVQAPASLTPPSAPTANPRTAPP